jgi:hypothetical protein
MGVYVDTSEEADATSGKLSLQCTGKVTGYGLNGQGSGSCRAKFFYSTATKPVWSPLILLFKGYQG